MSERRYSTRFHIVLYDLSLPSYPRSLQRSLGGSALETATESRIGWRRSIRAVRTRRMVPNRSDRTQTETCHQSSERIDTRHHPGIRDRYCPCDVGPTAARRRANCRTAVPISAAEKRCMGTNRVGHLISDESDRRIEPFTESRSDRGKSATAREVQNRHVERRCERSGASERRLVPKRGYMCPLNEIGGLRERSSSPYVVNHIPRYRIANFSVPSGARSQQLEADS